MSVASEIAAGVPGRKSATRRSIAFGLSLPLIIGVLAYIYVLLEWQTLLLDGDTYWHIRVGEWIVDHLAVPTHDIYSHTMRGNTWTAHEWLSEVVLALAHQWGGWPLVVALTALVYAATISLLTRALLQWLEPIYAVLFAALAASMTLSHALARPHMLAMPLLMIWVIGLVRASEARQVPSYWLLPVMVLWANMHGGFTLGIALTVAFGAESVWQAWREQRDYVRAARHWGLFLMLALAGGMMSPHGPQGLWFTWEVLTQMNSSLKYIDEWRSPNFQVLQPLELWLLGGIALVMYQGLKLPPFRLLLLVGLLHMSLKHARYIELLGLLAPLFVAAPFAQQWRDRQGTKAQLNGADRFLLQLTQPAGALGIIIGLAVFVAVPAWMTRVRPLELPALAAPAEAVKAIVKAGVPGKGLNTYGWGGYLIYSGIPVFIDGRADLYGETFFKNYVDALDLTPSQDFGQLLKRYDIGWTLLLQGTPAVAVLDRMPGWRRVYEDKIAVVHVKDPATPSTGGNTRRSQP